MEPWISISHRHFIETIPKSKKRECCDQIFSCYAAPTDHPAYTYDFPTSEDYEVFLETLQRSAEYNTGMTVTEEDQVVTLSTCVNTRKDYRYLVHGKLKQKIKMEE